jgi:hypothetical protein
MPTALLSVLKESSPARLRALNCLQIALEALRAPHAVNEQQPSRDHLRLDLRRAFEDIGGARVLTALGALNPRLTERAVINDLFKSQGFLLR